MNDQPVEKLRIDKWLWYARFFKTRSLAAEVANGGKVRINKNAIRKASAEVKVGDVLTFHQGHHVRVVEVQALGSSRRPYEEARLLYEDLAPLPDSRAKAEGDQGGEQEAPAPQDARTVPLGQRDFGAGRPTKRERRATDRLRDL